MKKLRMRILAPTICVLVGLFAGAVTTLAACGCMDLALIVDDSGSMSNALANVKAELPDIITTAQAASGSDLRIGLVTFPGVGLPTDGVAVQQAFTTDTTAIGNAVDALTAQGGAGEPEPSDAALQFVVTGAVDSECTVSNTPLGSFRSGCVRIAVLITDAHPGDCHDTFTAGVDDVHAEVVADDAAAAGVLVSAIYVPVGSENPVIKAIMQEYASISGGVFVETASDGTGTGEGISGIVASCGSLGSTQVITRTSRFWFSHGFSTDTNCATLLKAIQVNAGRLNLGFVNLPTGNRNADNVIDANDTFMEALGFFWRAKGRTGEIGGTQNQKLSASNLCKARKELSVELIAATANVRLLGTKPANATYVNGGTVTNFPSDLIQQARTAAAGDDINAVRSMTALLKKFNSSGTFNPLPAGLVECTAQPKKELRPISRDATTRDTCPGINDTCGAAEAVFFATSSNPFGSAVFKKSVSLNNYTDDIASPSCGTGGRDAVWKVNPTTGVTGRQFTVETDGSNFDTMISVWEGSCSNLTEVSCIDGALGIGQEQLSFTSDGTNTFFIVVEGSTGNVGKLKVKVTSP